MAELFILALLGHILGDYLFQPLWMAIKKSSNTTACIIHVLIYTLCVCTVMQEWDPWVALSIFIPHFIIDRWSLGEVWLRLIGGRTANGAMSETGVKREFAIAFYAPVYIIVDNGLHLLCIAGTIKLLMV